MKQHLAALFTAVAATAMLSACGGGGGGTAEITPVPSPPPPAPAPAPERGELVSVGAVVNKSRAQIDAFNASGDEGPQPTGETASCAATFREINYLTVDSQNTVVTASAGLLLPVNDPTAPNTACVTNRPMLSFQHGTSDINSFEGAAPQGVAPLTMAMYFVSHGYAVVVPDYLGYGASVGHYHPYVNADAEATTVIDAVRAARNWFATSDGTNSGVTLSGQLFLTGTSEGGYITMATHRAMESSAYAGEFTVTADVPISGPYNLSAEVLSDLTTADASHNSASGSTAFELSALQDVYGDIWTVPDEVFESPWDTTAPTLYPSALYGSDTASLQACQIPFNVDTSPGPTVTEADGVTVCPDRNQLLQPQFVSDYENAMATGVYTNSDGAVAAGHVVANDLILQTDWTNKAPMTVCYGTYDPTAENNALAAQTRFNIAAINAQTTGPSFITSWMDAQYTSTTSPLTYHGNIEAPGCTAYARYVVFDPLVGNVP